MTGVHKVVVFGSSSRQGQAQVGELLTQGHHVTAVTRHPAVFSTVATDRLQITAADFDDAASLLQACQGADTVFFQPPQFGGPERIQSQVENVAVAATSAAVPLAIYNSTMWVPDEPCGEPGYDQMLLLENLFVRLGPPAIIFRPVLFMDNLQTLFAKPALVGEGIYRYCHRPGLTATWICLADVAKFMVQAIDRPSLIGRRFVIGGTETLTIEQVLNILSPLIGKNIRHEFVPPRDFGIALAQNLGMPAGAERDGFIAFFESFYNFNNYSPHRPFEADVAPVLKQIPVDLTPFAAWAKSQDWSEESLQKLGDLNTVGSVSG